MINFIIINLFIITYYGYEGIQSSVVMSAE